MTRKQPPVKSWILLVAAVLAWPMPKPLPAEDRPPNIIYLLADDLGYGELGCYGQQIIQTPHLDQLAAQGIRFTQHYSGSPVCASSRCVLLTGMHSGHAYIRTNREHQPEGQLPIPDETVTLAELLKRQGYTTAAIGKWGLGYPGSSGDPNRQGFDLFYGYNCQRHAHNHYPRYLWKNDRRVELAGNTRSLTGAQYSQDLFAEQAMQFIRQHADQPFFLYLPFAIPHLSIQVPEESLTQYRGKIPEADYEHRGYLRHPSPRAGYAAMISHLDRDIGRLLALLDELNLADNTLVLFSSDNGPAFNRLGGSDSEFFNSAGPLRGRKGSVYEGGIRVPLIARWPGKVAPGQRTDHVSAFWDILPTLVQVAGGQVPPETDGISFLPTLLGQRDQQQQHEYLVWHFPSYGGQQAIRLGKWKGVRQNLLRGDESPLQLYDLEADLGETNDLAAEHPQLVQRMLELLQQSQSPSEHFPQL